MPLLVSDLRLLYLFLEESMTTSASFRTRGEKYETLAYLMIHRSQSYTLARRDRHRDDGTTPLGSDSLHCIFS